jgi:hypothetical protein
MTGRLSPALVDEDFVMLRFKHSNSSKTNGKSMPVFWMCPGETPERRFSNFPGNTVWWQAALKVTTFNHVLNTEMERDNARGRVPMTSSIVNLRIVFFQDRTSETGGYGGKLDTSIL